MRVEAGVSQITISTNKLAYQKGTPSTAKYGACYYEVAAKQLTDQEKSEILIDGKDAIKMQIKITKAQALNVYLYGGISRLEAKDSVTEDNEQVTLDELYEIDTDTGFLLVVYPTDASQSDFEFSYGLVGYTLPKPEPEVDVVDTSKEQQLLQDLEDKNESVQTVAYVLCIIVIACAAALGLGVCCACRRNKNQVNILNEDENGLESGQRLGTVSPRPPNNGNDTSMQLDDMEEEENPGMNIITKGEQDPEKTEQIKELIADNHSAIQEGGEIFVQKRASRKLEPLQNYPKVNETPF